MIEPETEDRLPPAPKFGLHSGIAKTQRGTQRKLRSNSLNSLRLPLRLCAFAVPGAARFWLRPNSPQACVLCVFGALCANLRRDSRRGRRGTETAEGILREASEANFCFSWRSWLPRRSWGAVLRAAAAERARRSRQEAKRCQEPPKGIRETVRILFRKTRNCVISSKTQRNAMQLDFLCVCGNILLEFSMVCVAQDSASFSIASVRHPIDRPLRHRLGAQAFIKPDRRLVPIEDRPFQPSAFPLGRHAGDFLQQRRPADSPAAKLSADKDVFEIDAGAAEECRKIMEARAKPTATLFSRANGTSAAGRRPKRFSWSSCSVATTSCDSCISSAPDQVKNHGDIGCRRDGDVKLIIFRHRCPSVLAESPEIPATLSSVIPLDIDLVGQQPHRPRSQSNPPMPDFTAGKFRRDAIHNLAAGSSPEIRAADHVAFVAIDES